MKHSFGKLGSCEGSSPGNKIEHATANAAPERVKMPASKDASKPGGQRDWPRLSRYDRERHREVGAGGASTRFGAFFGDGI